MSNPQRFKDYIEEHLAEELAIATLANLIPMSQFHFARALRGIAQRRERNFMIDNSLINCNAPNLGDERLSEILNSCVELSKSC